MGRGLPTGKELYSKMVDEADDMIMAMEEGREVDMLQEVMRYSGMEAGEQLDFGSFSARDRGVPVPRGPGGKRSS